MRLLLKLVVIAAFSIFTIGAAHAQQIVTANQGAPGRFGPWPVTLPSGASATQVQGTAADGAAASGNPVQIGGKDGSNNIQSILVDTSGRPNVVGAAADGAAVAGNPLLMAGQDGTNAQSMLVDTSGRIVNVGAAADGAAVAGNPILIAGQDGANAQSLLLDTSGRVIEAPSSASEYGQVLVLASAATEVASSALSGRRSIVVQNNGPNEMRCGDDNAVTTATGIAVAPNGGTVTLPIDAGLEVWCIAKTADQVNGAATNYWELN
jgi:hypothetical protein